MDTTQDEITVNTASIGFIGIYNALACNETELKKTLGAIEVDTSMHYYFLSNISALSFTRMIFYTEYQIIFFL